MNNNIPTKTTSFNRRLNKYRIALIVAVIVGALLVGIIGYFLGRQMSKQTPIVGTTPPPGNKSSSLSGSIETPPSDQSSSTIASGPGAKWNTYTNRKLGFSLQIPKEFSSPHGGTCEKLAWVYNAYGEKISSRAHYRPTVGLVPATIMEDDNNFYIVEEYTYQGTGYREEDGYTLASGCEKVKTTAKVLRDYKKPDQNYITLTSMPISIVDGVEEKDILAWASNYFDDRTITIHSIKSNKQGWQDVVLQCTSSEYCFNYNYELRFYKENKKLVYMELGQAIKFFADINAESYYDQDIVKSFKLID